MISSKLTGDVTFTYVMGGISKKTKNAYLQVSDGVEAKFVQIPKEMNVDEDTFSEYTRGDEINMTIEVDPFSGRMTVLEIQ